MATIADVYRALNALHAEGLVQDYAIGGGMGALFYAETTRTFDVDAFAIIERKGLLVDLGAIYLWARGRGYEVRDEYIVMHGVPVQILAAREGLVTEAVETANVLDYDGVPVRVMKPEYLIALYVDTGGDKRFGRARDLFAEDSLNREQLEELLARYSLKEKWARSGDGTL